MLKVNKKSWLRSRKRKQLNSKRKLMILQRIEKRNQVEEAVIAVEN